MPRSPSTAAALLLVLAGCAASPASDDAGNPSAASASSPTVSSATVDNCGTDVPLGQAPERVVTIKSAATEMLLALGLEDRIVATAFPDGPVPPDLAPERGPLPVLSESVPSQEAVLALEPDFVYAGWESSLTADAVGDRGFLASLGIGSYVSPSACRGEEHRPDKLGFEDVFDAITEAGAVFGAPEAAAELVAQQRILLDSVAPAREGTTVLWYSSGTDVPYVGAGTGAPQMILEELGLVNVAADVEDSWASLSWEAVVAADPDVIVLVDARWNTAESKKERLRADPATSTLEAVLEERFLVVPFAAGEAGVRNAEAVLDLAAQLEALEARP
ncbi:UNVERIFIED_CONTAM: putative F420-0 ABC transporter substrate-binding protein [Kocuria sp. CPCC 205316]|uniref:putative F420-0 ABC transporter substrate-binding protein n=1 Tax=Kocuria TaxID=57493 RepID=UPI0036DD78C9